MKEFLKRTYWTYKAAFPRIRYKGIVKCASSYDMVGEEEEKFFQEIYMYFIEERIINVFGKKQLNIIDAGCGQGRIAIPLARMGHTVTGIDLSDSAISQAKGYAMAAGVDIRFHSGDIGQEVSKLSKGYFDVLVCAEVLYMLSNYETIIDRIIRVVKPGGVIFLSLRPRLFYAYFSIIKRDFKTAGDLILNESKFLHGGLLNCLNKEEMVSLLESKYIRDIEAKGIGILSGIEEDPQANFILPSTLSKKQQELLLDLEIKLAEKYPDSGRYILLSGIKETD